MKKLNKWEKTFKELGVDLSSYKPTATQTKTEHHSYKEWFNSPTCKKREKTLWEELREIIKSPKYEKFIKNQRKGK